MSENVSGKFINATRLFGHYPSKTPVLFFVEGDDDVAFWSNAVAPYQEKYDIRVKTNKAVDEAKGNGKMVLLAMSDIGPNKMIAVDADYDLLIDNYSECTEDIRDKKYVVNSEYYSIENILSQPSLILELMEKIKGGKELSFDYADFISVFSEAIHDLFVYHLVCMDEKNDVCDIKKFGAILNKLNLHRTNYINDLTDFNTRYHKKFHDAFDSKKTQMTFIDNFLFSKGYQKSDTYKLIRGHYLCNIVVTKILKAEIQSYQNDLYQKRLRDNPDLTLHESNAEPGDYPSFEAFKNHFYNQSVKPDCLPNSVNNKLKKLFS